MQKKISARLHAILAREVDSAVIFRRGPSRKVAIISWNLKDDTFLLGQWFCGRIYEYRCDLSPNGSYLVYFAAKYGKINPISKKIDSLIKESIGERKITDEEYKILFEAYEKINFDDLSSLSQLPKSSYDLAYDNEYKKIMKMHKKEFEIMRSSANYYDASWTAISKTPYLTALDLWFNGSGWNGGGIFTDDKNIWINSFSEHIQSKNSGLFNELKHPPEGWGHCRGECPAIYLPKLLRDNWKETKCCDDSVVYEKKINDKLVLEKIFHFGPKGKKDNTIYWEEHSVKENGKILKEGDQWRWADFDSKRNRILFAKNGAIFALPLNKIFDAPICLNNFDAMTFEPKKECY